MKKEEQKIDFDLSVLNFEELIKTYDDIDNFLKYLNSKMIITEKKEKESNE